VVFGQPEHPGDPHWLEVRSCRWEEPAPSGPACREIASKIKPHPFCFPRIRLGWLKRGEMRVYEWHRQVQEIVDEIDRCIKDHNDEALTLRVLARRLGYSEFHTTRKFKEISGMALRDYLRRRKLAFALIEVRDSDKKILDIALDYGFSSHEGFTRAFRALYGVTPSEYRRNPKPVVLRTKINPFDRYFLGLEDIGMMKSEKDVKVYFVNMPAHKFLHIKNYESNGYWDFWEKQSRIPGQDCATICGLLDSIPGKLDDRGRGELDSGSGQIMGYIVDPKGTVGDWGFPHAECYGVRLPVDYSGEVPPQMLLMDVPEAEYVVFEHGPFDYEQETPSVGESVAKAMAEFDFTGTGYALDTTPGRIAYFYFDPAQYLKYVLPVKRV